MTEECVKPNDGKVAAFLKNTRRLLISQNICCWIYGVAITVYAVASLLLALLVISEKNGLLILFCCIGFLVGVIHFRLALGNRSCLRTMDYDFRPTMTRCESTELLITHILFAAGPHLVFYIINFVRMKANAHLISKIVSAQEESGWTEKVTDDAVNSLAFDDYLILKEYREAMQTRITEDAKQPFDSECILEIRHLRKCFPLKKTIIGKVTKELVAVDDVSFKLRAGETLGIVGESGCGKTTAGRAILKLHQPTGGQIIFNGEDITHYTPKQMRKFRKQMQIIFQDPYSSLPPRDTVGGILSEAVKVHKIVPASQVKDYVLELMEKCGLRDYYYERYPHEFSGGQRQRICIARALSVNPKLVICDEPVSALDVSIQAQIINLLKKLQKEMNLAYVFISHDLSVVKFISDKIGVMYLGSMVEFGTKEDIFRNPLHPYTKALFSAVPNPDPESKMERIKLEGDIPSPANPPKGCRFHTRCPYAKEVCKHVPPEYRQYGNGHFAACHLLEEHDG